jgi:hypothetical protein
MSTAASIEVAAVIQPRLYPRFHTRGRISLGRLVQFHNFGNISITIPLLEPSAISGGEFDANYLDSC